MVEYTTIRDENEQPASYRERILDLFLKYYLPISILLFTVFGVLAPQPGAFLDHTATAYVCIIPVFIISGLYLHTSEVREAIVSYKGAIYGLISILAITPIIGGQLTALVNFSAASHLVNSIVISNMTSLNASLKHAVSDIAPLEFKFALMLYFFMPCTVQSGIVMVTQLNGQVALAILLTALSNVVGIFTAPLWIKWMVASSIDVKLDLTTLIYRMCIIVLLPLVVGKCIQYIKLVRQCIALPNIKHMFKILNITLLDILVWVKVSTTSLSGELSSLTIANTLFVMMLSLAIHILFMLCNAFAGWLLRLSYKQKKVIIILCSQKTLSVGLSVVTFLPLAFGNQGEMIVVMVIVHVTLTVFDSLLVVCWLFVDSKRKRDVEQLPLNAQNAVDEN